MNLNSFGLNYEVSLFTRIQFRNAHELSETEPHPICTVHRMTAATVWGSVQDIWRSTDLIVTLALTLELLQFQRIPILVQIYRLLKERYACRWWILFLDAISITLGNTGLHTLLFAMNSTDFGTLNS